MRKSTSVMTLKRKLDAVWSQFVRLSEMNDTGYCQCCSCGLSYHWSEMDCGHFVSRNHNAGRYKRENCHAQCRKCNRFREGNKAGYAVFLQKKYGMSILEELNQLQYVIKHFTTDELQEILDNTNEQLKVLRHVHQ